MLLNIKGPISLRDFNIKIPVIKQIVSNLASVWLAAQPSTNQNLDYKSQNTNMDSNKKLISHSKLHILTSRSPD